MKVAGYHPHLTAPCIAEPRGRDELGRIGESMSRRDPRIRIRSPEEIAQAEADADLVRRAAWAVGSKAALGRKLSELGKTVTGGTIAHWEDTSRSVPDWVLAVCREVVA